MMFPNGEIALKYARRGFRVHPTLADREGVKDHKRKSPVLTAWPELATTDEETIRKWWSEDNYNIAGFSDELLVLDVDVRDGKPGLDSLEYLEMLGVLPDGALRVRTQSGGLHIWMRKPKDVWIGQKDGWMPGIDARGDNCYALLPGSTICGRPYTEESGSESVEAPPALLEMLRSEKPKKADKTALVPVDLPGAISRATDYLKRTAPASIQGELGNNNAFKVAARVIDFSISEAMCLDLMLEHWNERCEPPWSGEELEGIVQSAGRNRQGAIGKLSGLAEFEPAEILEPAKESRKGLYRVVFEAAKADALRQVGTPLIKGVIQLGSMVILYGASGSGKTFLMLDLAFHIAAGLPWHGHKVTHGIVLYVAAEGGRGIFRRIAALANHFEKECVPLDIVPCPINLLSSKADMKQLLALVAEAEAEHGQPVRLIVIDTLSRALAGGDENTSTDMGAFVKNIDKIRDATGATLAVVHHSGKDAAKGARGWSGLRAATDTEIEILEGVIRVSKQRDIDPIEDMRFKLESIPVGKDEDGEIETSCWVRILKKHEAVRLELGERGKLAMGAFNRCVASSASGGVSAGRWDDEIRIAGLKMSDRTLRDLRQELARSGWVKIDKHGQYVSVGPAEPAEPAK